VNKGLLLLFLSLTATSAYAVDGVYAEYGRGDASVVSVPAQAKIYRIGAMWDWNRSWLNDGAWHVTGFWDVSLAQWHGEKAGDNNRTVTDFGIMPVFRLAPKEGARLAPYLEAGILGVHLISPTYLYSDRRFSTAFQFGNILGFGVSLGEHRQFELGFRFQHESNGNIKLPNNGMDFNLLHLAYRF
jgi:lipid A 3-O-deacylase